LMIWFKMFTDTDSYWEKSAPWENQKLLHIKLQIFLYDKIKCPPDNG